MNLRICYLHDENLNASKGVARKISGQVAFWRSQGCHVDIIGLRKSMEGGDSRSGVQKLLAHWKNVHVRKRELLSNGYDLVYLRYIKWAPELPALLRGMGCVILELNTNDLTEFRLAGVAHGWYNRMTRSQVYGSAHGCVAVTHEILEQAPIGRSTRTIVIGNGIDPDHCQFRPTLNRNGQPEWDYDLTMTVGELSPWHGLDKILDLASEINELRIAIVGNVPAALTVPNNVTFTGPLTAEELSAHYSRTVCAVSTLALHRNRMNEGCPLKSREYLVHGVPMIMAYEDPDVPDTCDSVLRLPNTESNVRESVDLIRSFVWRARSMDREAISKKAIRLLSNSTKERLRLAFMDDVVSKQS